MNSLDATAKFIETLEQLSIPYMLVGAFSSNAYGIPRATKDADFVVQMVQGDLGRVAERLGSEFRLDRQMRLETITNSVRNVITYLPTRFDIELFRLSEDEHHAERFRRRTRRQIGELNCEAWIPTAEDVLIQKLRWQRRKDLDDVASVLAVSAKLLDWDYLTHWTKIHGTFDLLNQVRAECPNLNLIDDV